MFERCCDDREQAERNGEFAYIAYYEGWCFTDGPLRRVSTLARSNGVLRGVELHSGEPYAWLDCPFCGAALPIPKDDLPTFQADGGDGPE
jgi:hypothetical protein